jgi:TonB-linked SusC/RagA family outer membrane protein
MVVAIALPGVVAAQSTRFASQSASDAGELLQRRAHLDVEDVSLAVALVRLMESSGVSLAFSPTRLPADALVSCRCDSVSVGVALRLLLARTELVVLEADGRVMLIPDPSRTASENQPSRQLASKSLPGDVMQVGFAMRNAPVTASEQDALADRTRVATISGIVVDNVGGQPLAGARVYVVGTDHRSASDASGRFVLSGVPEGDLSLRVTMLGYRPAERAVRSGVTDLRIALERAALGLEGVVVTASGTQRIREVGSDIVRVRADSVAESSPATNISELLSARAPGVYVKTASGSSAGGTRIRIRGSSSPSLSNEPIVYVDGVRINTDPQSLSYANNQQVPSRFNDINPDEIESIDVLKGPSASTMYGTEAANGVILITTKSGSGATRRAEWRAWTETGRITEPNTYPANYRGVTAAGQTCLLSSVAAGTCTQAQVLSFNLIMDPTTTPFKTGNRQVVGGTLSGKSGDMNYFFSGEHENEVGVYQQDGVRKTNVRANFGVRPMAPLNIQVSAGYVSSNVNLFTDGGSGIGIVTNGLAGGACATCWFSFSPDQLARIEAYQAVDRFIGSTTATLDATKWLQIRGTVGLDVVGREDSRLFPVGVFPGARANGERDAGRNSSLRSTADLLARVDLPLTAAIASRTSVGVQYLGDRSATVSAVGTQLVPGTNSLGAAGLITTREVSSDIKSLGGYVEQQFGYHDRLFVTAGLRTDKNSSFGRESKTVVYPKVGASWVLSEESFFPSIPTVSSLRLRAALGQSGSQPGPLNAITYFGSNPVITPDGVNQVGISFENGNLGNPQLKPERSSELEVGFDAGLLAERVTLALTYYDKITRDALVLRQVAPSVGASTGRWENLSEVSNTGWEASVKARVLETRIVSIGLDASATYNKNNLVALGEGVAPITLGSNQRHAQ